MSEIETMRAMLRQLINRDAPPLSLADMRAAFDGWGESYPLPEGAATEPKTLGGIGAEGERVALECRPRAALHARRGICDRIDKEPPPPCRAIVRSERVRRLRARLSPGA